MSTIPQQDAGEGGERPVWDRRIISRVRRELKQEYLLVESAVSFASVSSERSVLIRFNDTANKFCDLVNAKIADYNNCVILTKDAENAANDLMVDIASYREKLDTTLQPKYVEEEGDGHRDVSFEAGSPIEKKATPVELRATDGAAAAQNGKDAALDKTIRISDSDLSGEEEEEEKETEATEENGRGGGNADQNGVSDAPAGGIFGRLTNLFKNSTPTDAVPAVNVIPPTPADKERSHTRSAASIARSLQAREERDKKKQEEEEQMEATRKQSEAEEVEAMRKVEEIRKQRTLNEKLHAAKMDGLEAIHDKQQQIIEDEESEAAAEEAMKDLEKKVEGAKGGKEDNNAAVERWAKGNVREPIAKILPKKVEVAAPPKGKAAVKLNLKNIKVTPPKAKPLPAITPIIRKDRMNSTSEKKRSKEARRISEEKEKAEKRARDLEAQLKQVQETARQMESALNAVEEDEEEEEEDLEKMPLSPSYAENSGFCEMVKVQTQMYAMSQLKEARPEKKFAACGKKVDFSKHMLEFETALGIAGLTETMKLNEFHHYFEGSALQLIEAELRRKNDAEKAASDAISKLNRKFGTRKETALEMMDELLQGKQIGEKDHGGLLSFYCRLTSIHTLACDTNRGTEFENKLVVDSILSKKIPHLSAKWAKRSVKDAMAGGKGLNFAAFLSFLDEEHAIAEYCYKNSGQAQQIKPIGAKIAATTATTTKKEGATAAAATPPKPAGGCGRCGGQHRLPACDIFKGLAVGDRRKFCMNTRSCYQCLEAGHMARNCQSPDKCPICGSGHHELLHPVDEAAPAPPGETNNTA